MTEQTPEERWQQRTEGPLAMVAIAFLVIYPALTLLVTSFEADPALFIEGNTLLDLNLW